MISNVFKRIFGSLFCSVFTKLLGILFLSWCVITVIVWGTFRHHAIENHRPVYKENLKLYMNFLINDLGAPPALKKAQLLSKKTSLAIQNQDPKNRWSTSDQFDRIPPGQIKVMFEDDEMMIGRYRAWFLLKAKVSDGDIVFLTQHRFFGDENSHLQHSIFLFSILSVILILMFLAIRWVLMPVKWLSRGVKEVSSGNLEPNIPMGRRDELGDLSLAFMDMTDRIRKMLKARNQLLLDVSHELRSPLTRINVALEFLNESPTKKSIKEDVSELMGMITDILETERMIHTSQQLDFSEEDLTLLLKKAVKPFKLVRPLVNLQPMVETYSIKVDASRVGIALNNILTNAVKYSEKNGPPVQVFFYEKEERAVICVKDFGSGISEAELPHIFEPFYRVDKSRSKKTGGYGLGLGLVKSIMEAHGGNIEIESSLGNGTTVTLSFPKQS